MPNPASIIRLQLISSVTVRACQSDGVAWPFWNGVRDSHGWGPQSQESAANGDAEHTIARILCPPHNVVDWSGGDDRDGRHSASRTDTRDDYSKRRSGDYLLADRVNLVTGKLIAVLYLK
jgi:hypothetical protein